MNELPVAYRQYLEGKTEDFVDTIAPILKQSAADELHGVRVIMNPHVLQAHLDDKIPYGSIVESID
ncbi:hypothetical protein [Arthrobacter sp. 35W]|uniref:hypothetical protein n=1 Tax=Arthrobacter sp. 35W TaxID=1132441 RepID=UPI00047E2EA5|nr:hypothetical protein [Arthrobacter sp. 35W]